MAGVGYWIVEVHFSMTSSELTTSDQNAQDRAEPVLETRFELLSAIDERSFGIHSLRWVST
jgi:hypothetical protein